MPPDEYAIARGLRVLGLPITRGVCVHGIPVAPGVRGPCVAPGGYLLGLAIARRARAWHRLQTPRALFRAERGVQGIPVACDVRGLWHMACVCVTPSCAHRPAALQR